ncbi:hypothetical protein KP509_1Z322400 [Ceratopteris richardii]|nr:hypothetical protein KP509_1Z322400 [Ceratopteris richardii]
MCMFSLSFQNGRFDAPDRLFVSIADSWQSVNSNPADLKELIPEFFCSSWGLPLYEGRITSWSKTRW